MNAACQPVAVFRSWSDRRKRMDALLAAIAAFSLVDLTATLIFMCTIGMFESNPIVVHLARLTGSAEAIAIFKIATVAVGITILYRVRDRAQTEVASWGLAFILLFVCARWIAYSGLALELTGYATFAAGDGWVQFNGACPH